MNRLVKGKYFTNKHNIKKVTKLINEANRYCILKDLEIVDNYNKITRNIRMVIKHIKV